MSDFKDLKFALPLPMSFQIQDGQYGLQLGIFIPSEAEVYDFTKKQKVKTNCVQIFSKAMDGQYGVFGNINPQKIENAPVKEDLPF